MDKISKQKIYFITYGDKKYNISKRHLVGLAKHSKLFDYTIAYGPKDIDTNFRSEYQKILSHERGGGFWLWKYYFINKLVNEVNKNDLIIYCDAGASLNFYAKKRLDEYIESINDSAYGNFRIECEPHFIENEWTSSQIFNYFKIDQESEIGNSIQLEGGHMIFKKNQHTMDYLDNFKKIMEHDQLLITDSYNQINQLDKFVENRHDQSIFSMLSKIHGCESVINETEFKNNPQAQYDYPFLSVRKGGHGLKDKIKFNLFYFKKIKTPTYFEIKH